jgi:photosystem II stability/assembly factor-like uncharacterized protein
MKTKIYLLLLMLAVCFSANAQWVSGNVKFKNLDMPHISQNSNGAFNNNNASWKDVNVPQISNSFEPEVEVPTADAVWVKVDFDSLGNTSNGDSKYFLQTANGGASWRLDSINSPAGYVISGLAPVDGQTCYALIHFFDAKNGVAVGDGNGPGTPYLEIYTTNDYGATWKRVPSADLPTANGFPYSTTFNAYTVVGSRIWFRGYDSNGGQFLYRSDDKGKHWENFPLTVRFFNDFAFSDSLNGVSTGFNNKGKVYINTTTDGGITWKRVNYTGSPMGLWISSVPGTSTFVTSIGTGTSYTNDYGKTWTLIDSNVSPNHTAVKFFNSHVGWTGTGISDASSSGGFYKWKGSFSTLFASGDNEDKLTDAGKQVASANSILLYPNPAKNVLTINGLSSSGNTICVIDISGRLLQQLKITATSYTINIEKLLPGNYFLQIQSGNKNTTQKFVKE